MNPLVVTLALDGPTQERFDAQRARLFPRSPVGAHVTLFHAVPGELRPTVEDDLRAAAGPPFDVAVERVQPLGRGAAYALASPELALRHRALQQAWWAHLTAQDRQGFRPHVTVQNKVDAATAKRTVEQLRAAFVPFTARALGFALWRYDGGPWTRLTTVPFP